MRVEEAAGVQTSALVGGAERSTAVGARGRSSWKWLPLFLEDDAGVRVHPYGTCFRHGRGGGQFLGAKPSCQSP